MIPYGRQTISEEDIEAVIKVLRSDWITQGPVVPRFEKAIAEYSGSEFAYCANSATSALHVACLALGVGPGDRVWTSPNTFAASANCALYCGASVDFVDIDSVSYNMSIEELYRKLELAEISNSLPKVVIPVHFAGQSCEMDEIAELSRRYGFRILEDASHAIGGKYRNSPIGDCRYSDIAVFSFHPVKVITTGEGGIALTNDPRLGRAMDLFRNHGITKQPDEMVPRPSEESWGYQQQLLGHNYRMTDLEAALGLSQLRRLDEFVNKRRAIAEIYDRSLGETEVVIPWQHPDADSSYHLYPVRLKSRRAGKSQAQLVATLRDAGIAASLHYIPVYLHPYYQSLGFSRGYCPVAEEYFRETISLPIFPSLSRADQQRVIETVTGFFA